MFKKFKFIFFFIIFFANVISILAKVDFANSLLQSKSVTVDTVRKNAMQFEQFPKDQPCVVVSLVWYNASEDNGIHHQLGGILSDRIIITSWAPDFSHERESRGYCVLGFDLTNGLRDDQIIPWRTVVSADNSPAIIKKSADAKNVFKIALINLERSITFGKEIGGYKFAALPSITQLEEKYDDLPKKDSTNYNRKLDAFLPFLDGKEKKQLMVARIAPFHPDYLRDYKKFYEPQGKEAPFWAFNLFFRSKNQNEYSTHMSETARKKLYKRGNCDYQKGGEGSPIIYNHRLLGINFYHAVPGRHCQSIDTYSQIGGSTDTLLASRVDLYANWINRIKNVMEEDNKKVRYSRLSPFVMFYGNKDSKEVGGLVTFLGEKFAMTHYMDNSKLENLRVLPGIKRLVPPFDGSKGIAIADVRNYGGDTQLAIVELESEINEGQYEIKLPATLYPISGSRCEIMTILTAKTNREELTSRNNFDFSDDAQILHEVRVIPWDYRECKRYMNELKENQFCIRLDGDVQNRNHCELITAGNPVICNGQVTGIVNDPEPPCKPHKPRICTNVFQLLDWVRKEMQDESLSSYIEEKEEQKEIKKKKKKKKGKNIKKKDDGNGRCHPAIFIIFLCTAYFIYNRAYFIY
ncbi:uncharacterized protein ACN2A1_006845 isoform 1-T1 [Glossina fuscipes fuscipes]